MKQKLNVILAMFVLALALMGCGQLCDHQHGQGGAGEGGAGGAGEGGAGGAGGAGEGGAGEGGAGGAGGAGEGGAGGAGEGGAGGAPLDPFCPAGPTVAAQPETIAVMGATCGQTALADCHNPTFGVHTDMVVFDPVAGRIEYDVPQCMQDLGMCQFWVWYFEGVHLSGPLGPTCHAVKEAPTMAMLRAYCSFVGTDPAEAEVMRDCPNWE